MCIRDSHMHEEVGFSIQQGTLHPVHHLAMFTTALIHRLPTLTFQWSRGDSVLNPMGYSADLTGYRLRAIEKLEHGGAIMMAAIFPFFSSLRIRHRLDRRQTSWSAPCRRSMNTV